MMKELKSHEPYEVSPGCPTITFDLVDESVMLPWSSFANGSFKDSRITLNFQEWRIEIEGNNLDDLWRLLQMQDLRCVGISSKPNGNKNDCYISSIETSESLKKKAR